MAVLNVCDLKHRLRLERYLCRLCTDHLRKKTVVLAAYVKCEFVTFVVISIVCAVQSIRM